MSFDPQRRHLLNLALGAGVAPALVGCVNLGSREPCFGLGVASGCPRPGTTPQGRPHEASRSASKLTTQGSMVKT